MKNFIQSRRWEDWLVYAIMGVMILGLIIFVVGYLFQFEQTNSASALLPPMKTNIAGILKGNSLTSNSWDTTDLFTLMGSLTQGTKAYQMSATAVSGFASLMADLLIFVIIIIYSIFDEYIAPKLSKNA